MSNRKLLLADDSITIQKVVNLTFADEGIEVIAVGDGNSAMDKLREEMPDLVMADVNMPGLNGYEICEKIKLSEGGSEIPVILLVGSFEPFDKEEAERVGADDYLTKPFHSISQLVDKVSELLKLDKVENLEDTAEMPFYNPDTPSEEDALLETSEDISNNINYNSDEFEDEIIQTDQIGSLPVSDAYKYQSSSNMPEMSNNFEIVEDSSDSFEVDENYYGNESDSAEGAALTANSSYESQATSEDFNKTQPLTDSEYHQLAIEEPYENETLNNGEINGVDQKTEESPDDAENYSESFEVSSEKDNEELISNQENADLPMPEAASILELDEFNLLDLPPLEGVDDEPRLTSSDESETSFKQEAVDEPEISAEVKTREDDEKDEPIANSHSTFFENPNDDQLITTEKALDNAISSEMVDVITRKVVERLSEKAVRDIAWEVVPQLADLIVKQLAEEKMKD